MRVTGSQKMGKTGALNLVPMMAKVNNSGTKQERMEANAVMKIPPQQWSPLKCMKVV